MSTLYPYFMRLLVRPYCGPGEGEGRREPAGACSASYRRMPSRRKHTCSCHDHGRRGARLPCAWPPLHHASRPAASLSPSPALPLTYLPLDHHPFIAQLAGAQVEHALPQQRLQPILVH